jgi:hypothetical protein
MKKFLKILFVLLLVAIIISSCAFTPAEIQAWSDLQTQMPSIMTALPMLGTPQIIVVTATSVPPTNTNTPLPPTSTFTLPPTPTNTFTFTPIPPTKTFTLVPTNTFTSVPPTKTFTLVPVTATNTRVPTRTNTPNVTTGIFYVDSVSGLSSNTGKSENSPWASISGKTFSPGSIIKFKTGSVFPSGTTISSSGTELLPITFTYYGEGVRPAFENPATYGRGLTINGDWVILDGLLIRNTYDAGVYINTGADNVILQNSEITNTGIGATARGVNDKILNNYIHDTHMVHNDAGGDDDYGANGILLSGNPVNTEIAYNRIVRCKATSFDYGVDGGTIEFYGAVSGANIHHNYAEESEGLIEIGGSGTPLVTNNTISYNVTYNNGRVFGAHIGTGGFNVTLNNMILEHNTIVDFSVHNNTQQINFWGSTPTIGMLIFRNNIMYTTTTTKVASHSTFTHSNNLFYFGTNLKTTLGFTLGVGEIKADPLFVDVTNKDFHLLPSSPAIGMGAY